MVMGQSPICKLKWEIPHYCCLSLMCTTALKTKSKILFMVEILSRNVREAYTANVSVVKSTTRMSCLLPSGTTTDRSMLRIVVL